MENGKLRIVHCFRSPVGGIFRHVRDLIEAHSSDCHELGIVCDSSTGGAYEERLFDEIRPQLALGLIRFPMRRAIAPSDLSAIWRTYGALKELKPDIIHAHGAKGGAYARIIGSLLRVSGTRVARLYCPHGGSVHYDGSALSGRLYFGLERALERMTDRLIFVSRYEMDGYSEKVGIPRCPVTQVYNGLRPGEFEPVSPAPDAADFLYIGMMRDLKGTDLFIEALAILASEGIQVSAHLVGDGPDKPRYAAMIDELNLTSQVTIHDAMPARKAFALARIVVVPSRAESMPYIVLEAIAANRPVICTRVGGIPEIFAGEAEALVEPGSASSLAEAMKSALRDADLEQTATRRREMVQNRFSVERMADDIMEAYRATLDNSVK